MEDIELPDGLSGIVAQDWELRLFASANALFVKGSLTLMATT
jgi:hypothetical protein